MTASSITMAESAAGNTYVIQAAISAYADEAYTNARKLSSTGLVGSNPNIDRNTETFVGQVRWFKPIDATVNVASLTVAAAGTLSVFSSDFLKYVKTVRTAGMQKLNMAEIITQQDGLAKFGRDFAEIQAQDEHDAILAVLRGVALAESVNGAGAGSGATGLGGQTFDNDPTDQKYGFYVDLAAASTVPLIKDATAILQGAARAEAFLTAFGMAWKDYEPEYAYLVVTPSVMASLRSANLVDQDRITDGNMNFQTIFDGKFRLVSTRENMSISTADLALLKDGAGVEIKGTITSFIVLPGAIAMENLTVPVPTEIERSAKAYAGGGTTDIWRRWGYIAMPTGMDWIGDQEAFPTNAEYQYVVESGTPKALSATTSGIANTTGTWGRKASSALSLGILPVFHD